MRNIRPAPGARPAEWGEVINREVAERMPGAVWHEVEGGGHFIAMGCVEEILRTARGELGK